MKPHHQLSHRSDKSRLVGLAVAITILGFMAYNVATTWFYPLEGGPGQVTLQLDSDPTFRHAAFYYARDQRWYSQEGLNVRIVPGKDATETIKLVASGKTDYGFVPALDLVAAASRGLRVTAVYMVDQESTKALITLKASGISSPKDLEGRRLAGTRDYLSAPEFLEFANKNKLDMRKVGILHEASIAEAIGALVGGRVDAIMADFADVIYVRLKGMTDVVVLPFSRFGVRSYGYAVIVGSEKLKSDSQQVERFVRATKAGWEATLITNLCSPIHVLHAYNPKVTLLEEFLKLLESRKLWLETSSAGKRLGFMSASQWEATVQMLVEHKAIAASVNVNEIFINVFVERLA